MSRCANEKSDCWCLSHLHVGYIYFFILRDRSISSHFQTWINTHHKKDTFFRVAGSGWDPLDLRCSSQVWRYEVTSWNPSVVDSKEMWHFSDCHSCASSSQKQYRHYTVTVFSDLHSLLHTHLCKKHLKMSITLPTNTTTQAGAC